MLFFSSPESRIAEFTAEADFFLGFDSTQNETREGANAAVEQLNAWSSSESHRIETEKSELDLLKAALEETERQLAAGAGGETYDRRQELVREWNRRLPDFNGRVETFNETHAKRRREVEALQRNATKAGGKVNRWLNKSGPLKLSTRINALFGQLLVARRTRPSEAARLDRLLARLRQLRGRVAHHTIQNQLACPTGILIVPARLENEAEEAEDCWFMIDNGCSSSTFTPEIIHALGLGSQVGAKVQLQLANGSRIKAPQCAAPGVSVDGCRASFIKGVVLRETTAGLDGTLGMSFLTRFEFSIHKAKPQRLVLQRAPSAAIEGKFDIFICFKSEDSRYARMVYTELCGRGYRPFLSEVSLPALRTTDYAQAIDEAIVGASHLVLICSNAKHAESPWVRAEWRLFESLRRSGEKSGNVVPVLFDRMLPKNLPASLSVFHSVTAHGPVQQWIGSLVDFLPRG